MKRLLLAFSIALASVLAVGPLTGCQTLTNADGTVRAATFNDNAVATLQGTDAVVKVAHTLLVAKKITPDDADSVAKMADAVRQGVAVAKSAEKTQPGTGSARLRAASSALDELSRYLATKK